MATYLILAQSDATANALEAWWELLGEKHPCDENKHRIIWQDQSVGDSEKGVLAYSSLVRRIEEAAADPSGEIPLNEVIVLVDAVRDTELNPLAENGGWNNLIAMLILTFPEIRWVFGVSARNNVPVEYSSEYHSLTSLLTKPLRDPLFDATGLRDYVRRRINDNLSEKNFPVRKERAAAIDEENNYALFHAFIAYRFGYRADAIRSWALMSSLFVPTIEERSKVDGKGGHGFHLLLEDVNLNFPDKPAKIHLSTFCQFDHENDGNQGRAKHCSKLSNDSKLETSTFRVIVTSGHSGTDREKMQKNIDFVKGYKTTAGSAFVLKPVGGMFDLWGKARLFSRLDPRKGHKLAGSHRGQAPGFHWPPAASDDAKKTGGHSAPGKLMLIAQNLVRRADSIKDKANTVEECIRGAILATDALELLRYQTPTLALQALCLKHEFEVKAEVAFLGVGHHFALKPRFSELEREVKVASQFFQKKRRKAAELDTLVSIGNRLMLVFREAGQFDEELTCLAKIRSWHRKLRFLQSKNPFDFIASVFMGYAEWLMARPANFIIMLITWFVVFWGLWYVSVNKGAEGTVWASASSAWSAFICAEPGDVKPGTPDLALNMIATGLGLFHLGVFISYLYSAIARK